jgi:hypothetical protein
MRTVFIFGVALLTGCEYPYFLKTRFNDSQLSCEEIERQITETQKVIDRGFADEYGPMTAGLIAGHFVGMDGRQNRDRRDSKTSAVERRNVLLSLRSERCE